MSYNLGTAWLQVSISASGIKNQLQTELNGATGVINNSTRGWGSTITSTIGGAFKSAAAIGGVAIAGATAFIASYSGEALAASDSAQKFASTLKFAGLDDSKIKALTESTKKYAAQTVYDITDIRNTTAALAANGVEGYEELAQAAGNLNAVAGGNAETFKTVGSVMTQTAGAGKLVTENWNQLRDAVPGASKRIKDALAEAGAYTGDFNEAMAKGEITAEEFNKAIMDLGFEDAAVKAASSTETFEGAWGNFEATIVDGLSELIDLFKGDLTTGLNAAADALSSFFNGAKDAISGLRSILQDGDFTGFGDLGIEEDHPLIDFLFTAREQIGLFKDAWMPIAGIAAGALGPMLSGLPLIGGLFSGLTGPVGLVIGLFSQMYSNSETFRKGLGDLGAAVITAFSGFAPAIEPVLNIISTLSTNLGNALGSVMRNLAPVVGNLANVLGGVFASALSVVSDLVSAASEVFALLVDVFSQALADVLPMLTPAIEGVGLAFDQIKLALDPLLDSIMATLMPLIEQLAPVLTEIAGYIVSAMGEVINVGALVVQSLSEIIVALTPFIQTVMNNLIPVVMSFWNTVSTVFESVKNVISAAMDVISGIIKTITAIIKGDWSGAWEGIKSIVSGVWEGIKSTIDGTINTIKSIISTVLNSISALFESIWNGVKDGVTSVWEGIKSGVKEGIDSIYNTITGIKDSIINFFTGAGRWLWDAGAAIINGFVDGIKSGFQWVKDSLSTLTSWLPDWKGPVEVDRVILREAGQLVIGGFIDGMESKYADVENTLGGLTRGLGDAVSTSFEFKGSQSLEAPHEIVVVDADGALIGRMQIEAEAVVGSSLEGAQRSRLREELGVEEF